MSYLLFVRQPQTQRLKVIVDDDGEIEEYRSANDAELVARHNLMCQAWEFLIVEVEL